MELISVLVCHLFIFTSCEGLKISSKLSFGGESGIDSDVSSNDEKETGNKDVEECDKDPQNRTFEAKIPFVLGRKKDRYEIKIPVAVESERTAQRNGKIAFFNGFDLFERRTTPVTERTTVRSVPIVKGSLTHIKPDFLVPIPRGPKTTSSHTKESYAFESFWPVRGPHEQKNEIESLNSPSPVDNQWILNTTPFLSIPRNTTARPSLAPPLNANKLGEPSLWNILESSSWKPRDPLSWNKNQGSYWLIRKPGWIDFGSNYQNNYPNYYTPKGGYPARHPQGWNTYRGQGGKPKPRGRWISCPPFEVNHLGPSARNVIPGCPQHPSAKPSDVDIISALPVTNVDDKTSFKDFVEKPDTTYEEPKVGQ